MKPFSMRRILKDTCNNHSFQRKRNQSLYEMKKAPKKPILKPFQEEQQSPMGHSHCAPAATNNQRMQITEGMESFSFHQIHCKSLGECCSSR